ncbi:OmpA family protein [Bacteroidota bacterium]
MKKIFVVIVIELLFLVFELFSQPSGHKITHTIGFFGHYNYNIHSVNFQELPGIPNCCPNFETGTGNGFSIGMLYEKPLTDNILVGSRAFFATIGATLSKIEPLISGVIVEGQLRDGEFEHIIEADISTAGIEAYAGYKIIDDFMIRTGLRVSNVMTKTYDQVEKLTKPVGYGTFLDSLKNDSGKRTRNEFADNIPQANSLYLFAFAGLSYDLPMNKSGSLVISPEINFSYGFSPVVDNYDWHINYLSAGIAMKYNIFEKPVIEEEYKDYEQIDTITVESEKIAENTFRQGIPIFRQDTSNLGNKRIITHFINRTDTLLIKKELGISADIYAVGVDSSGKEIANPTFVIEEFQSSQLHPLLNYIFFENNSSELPKRYSKLVKSETEEFYPAMLRFDNVLPIYYNILNIVGRRLLENPTANLSIVGCNSGIGVEKDNIDLSKNRAAIIRNYLIDVWNIPVSRLKVEQRNIPEKASTPIENPDKIAENRRVELYSKNYEILKPVLIADTIRRINLPIMRFYLTYRADAGVGHLITQIFQAGSKLIELGTGQQKKSIDWKLAEEQETTPKLDYPIDYCLSIVDNKGKRYTSSMKSSKVDLISIKKKTEERIDDKIIDRYSLILFDFDNSDVKGMNKEIAHFIKNNLKANSTIKILGYTDRTGATEYNKQLSLKRAEEAATTLDIKTELTEGYGEEILLYDNNLPEGRFYCRTVKIIVETPVKK